MFLLEKIYSDPHKVLYKSYNAYNTILRIIPLLITLIARSGTNTCFVKAESDMTDDLVNDLFHSVA